jgi:hypothetical protein
MFEQPKDSICSHLPALTRPSAISGAQLSLFTATILVFIFTLLLSLPHTAAYEGFYAPQINLMYAGLPALLCALLTLLYTLKNSYYALAVFILVAAFKFFY